MFGAALLAPSILSAQNFIQVESGSDPVTVPSIVKSLDTFSTFSFAYNPVTPNSICNREYGIDKMDAFSLAWNEATRITKFKPMYLGYGLGVQYSFDKDVFTKDYTGKDGSSFQNVKHEDYLRFITAKVPVELLFRIGIPNTNIAVVPFGGFDALLHVVGKKMLSVDLGPEYGSEFTNLFNQEEFPLPLRRFNVDWHIGMKLMFNRFLIGASYEAPIIPLYKGDDMKISSNQLNLSIGMAF